MRFSYLLIIALIALGYSCKEQGGKYIDEGEIHYNITYKGNFIIPTEALPQNLIVSFKKDKILFEMIGLGNSGIVNLANPDKGIYDTYYNFLGLQKYYYEAEPGEIFPGFASMKDMKIDKTSKTAVICGYNCKNATVTFGNNEGQPHEIWYTDEIKVDEPNASTPFSEIHGVLMSFFFIMGTAEINFNAETVYKKDVPDDVFDRRPKYVRVSKSDIEEVMTDLYEHFKAH